MSDKVEKTQAERITECMTIVRKLINDVGIDAQNPSIRVLKNRMAQYWRDGKLYEDKLPLWGYDRSIIYKFPRWKNQEVEVTLRVNKIRNPAIPADLEEEVSRQEKVQEQEQEKEQSMQNQPPTLLPTQTQVDAKAHQPPPSDPAVEPESGTSSETQSGPSHPSQPE